MTEFWTSKEEQQHNELVIATILSYKLQYCHSYYKSVADRNNYIVYPDKRAKKQQHPKDVDNNNII